MGEPPTPQQMIDMIDAFLRPMECRSPGNPAPGIDHCAACCYGTGWETTCQEEEDIVYRLLSARAALRKEVA